jgi:UDP-glucose 4-epimerase
LDIETNEDHSISCLNPYSISKFFGEELCRYYSLNMGLETVVFRYFNVFGERSPDKGNYAPVVGIFLKQFRNGEPLTIFGSGLQKRDFIHVKDVVSANILAMNLSERTNGKPINIGSGYNVSLNSIAKLFNTQVYHYPRREGEVMNTLSSTKRAMDILGFYPTIRVEEWVADQVNKIKS